MVFVGCGGGSRIPSYKSDKRNSPKQIEIGKVESSRSLFVFFPKLHHELFLAEVFLRWNHLMKKTELPQSHRVHGLVGYIYPSIYHKIQPVTIGKGLQTSLGSGISASTSRKQRRPPPDVNYSSFLRCLPWAPKDAVVKLGLNGEDLNPLVHPSGKNKSNRTNPWRIHGIGICTYIWFVFYGKCR